MEPVSEVEVTPEPDSGGVRYIQALNPETGLYDLWDTENMIIERSKKSPGPYKDVPIVKDYTNAGNGTETGEVNAED